MPTTGDRITAKSLEGGQLQAVMAARMFDADSAAAKKKFVAACKQPDPKALAAWAKVYGWTPPAELAEWEGCVPGYAKVQDDVSDVWMLCGSIQVKGLWPIEKLVNNSFALMTLLTGLERWGDDPSGDSSWVATLPHPKRVAEVHVYNHENGELDGATYYSIADFVFTCWAPDDESKADAAITRAFNKTMKAARGKLALEPRALFDRMKWMWGLPAGEPGYRFAEDMARAPTFAVWQREKATLARQPVLANYWMLAHYFLGNTVACGEAVALAKKAPGTLTPGLAKLVGALLADPKARLGALKPAALAELRAAVAKNAEANLLEPGARAAAEQARATPGLKADAKVLRKRLAAGEDGWTLLAEFPDDLAAHDLVLAALAKRDKATKAMVARYEKQRAEDDVWDKWPDQYEPDFDRRLSPAVGAAFRAGLKFDSDHKRAAASLVNTLAYLDDDTAMTSFAAAIEQCRMDDPRLEYVVAALGSSKHPGARAILDRAAWRFFEFWDETRKSIAKTKKQGPTLDNMFRVHSHLLSAVLLSIRVGDDASEPLVDKVCSIREHMTVLGPAYASAFKQVGKKRLERHADFATGYVRAVLEMDGEFLSGEMHYNLAEAALAAARLQPAVVEPLLRGTLTATKQPLMKLDQIAGALAGLLYLAPGDPDVLAWAERILGNRTGSARVYGPLRGIADGKVAAGREWTRWHLYAGCSSNHIGEKPAILAAARAALVALGEPEAPPFDEADEFASDRAVEDLPAALLEPHHHHIDNVFERIVEEELRSPDVVRIGGQVLRDVYRYSGDDGGHGSCDERKAGLACMISQGAAALPELWSLLALPHMAASDKTVVLYTASVIADAPALLARLATATDAQVLAGVAPTAANLGGLDLAAGWALAALGERAHAAIEAAFTWRFAMTAAGSDHWIDSEPSAGRLARLAAQLPDGKRLLDEVAKRHENYHVPDMIEHARKTVPAALTGMAGDELVVIQRMKEHGDTTYTCTVRVAGKAVELAYQGEDLYFEGIVEERGYTQTGTIAAASPEAARAIADRVCRALSAVGFAPPPPPPPAKGKGKGKRK